MMNIRNLSCSATLIACALTSGAVAASGASTAEWQFDVSLDGKSIGYHTFELQQRDSKQILTTEARFDVRFLFVTAFRYRHQNTEIWSDGCLMSIDASTNSNGKELMVRGSKGQDRFSLQSAEGSTDLPQCVQSFAYWNPAMLSSTQLLNSQTGVYEDVSVTLEGRDEVPVGGTPTEALRYRLSAQAGDITLWYSAADNTWLGLEAPAKGGRRILYQAVAVPETGPAQQVIARSD